MTGNSSRQRMPTIYIPHGGGPWPWIPDQRESYAPLRSFFGAMQGKAGPEAPSIEFDDWLASSVAMPDEQRTRRLLAWSEAPRARDCHPREEHLLPLHVVVGAGLDDTATLPFRGNVLGARVSAVRLG